MSYLTALLPHVSIMQGIYDSAGSLPVMGKIRKKKKNHYGIEYFFSEIFFDKKQ